MSLTTNVYQLLYEGLRDGWLCLDDLGPDLAGVQVWLALSGSCPLHDDPAAPCRNVVVRELDASRAVARYRHCDPDGPEPAGDTNEVVAVRVLWSDGTPTSSTRACRLLPPGGGPPPHRTVTTWRVTVAGGYVVARSPNLPIAVAQARALALRGYAT